MKKLISVIIAIAMIACLFAGCGASAADDGVYKIAIVQQLDHASLNEIRTFIESELEAVAAEEGIAVEYKVFNGQNDTTVLGQIGAQVVSDDYDAIIPIATLAAQCMVTAADGYDIPIIYAAISDPAAAGLDDLPNVTGTSDALNTRFILDMMFAVDSDIQTIGLLYSNSEPNSEKPIREAKEYLDEKGIAYLEKTGNTADEVIAAANALVGRCDAVFTPTDNVVMNVAAPVAEILNTAGIPHYTGADSFVAQGAFATCSVSYSELGMHTARMAMDVLLTGEVPEFHVMEGGIITVNGNHLDLDYSEFYNMPGQVVEVEYME